MPMRPRLRSLVLFLLIIAAASVSGGGIRPAPIPSPVEDNTAFAFDLYTRLKSQSGNLFFSPCSISTSLAAVYAGARGDTAKQMAQTLRFQSDQTHSAMGRLKRELNEAGKENGIELIVADALWTQSGHRFLPAFLKTMESEYQINPQQADFGAGAEAAREEINHWISQKTREKIQEALPPRSLKPITKIVLANAIYFKGTWTRPFEKSETRLLPFHVSPANQVRTAFMHHLDTVKYAENADFQAIELPYGKPRAEFSMLVLLPRQIDGYSSLESRLNPDLLRDLTLQLKSQPVDIYVPRFKLDSSLSLNSILSAMGMPVAFTPAANFSGMDGTHLLYLSFVSHKAWCEVNEEGTEAAASTVVVGVLGGGLTKPLPPPAYFRADHPFLFLIRDNRSGSILFWGRVMDPTRQ